MPVRCLVQIWPETNIVFEMSPAPSTPVCPPRVLVPQRWSALWLFHSIKGFCQTDDPNSFQKNLTQSVHSGIRSRRQRWESCAPSSQCENRREVHFARTLAKLSTLSLELYLTDMCHWSIFHSVRIREITENRELSIYERQVSSCNRIILYPDTLPLCRRLQTHKLTQSYQWIIGSSLTHTRGSRSFQNTITLR